MPVESGVDDPASLSREARRHGALHIDEHFTDPAGMGAGAGLDIPMSD
jgi:hypothetical protein